MAKKRRKVRTIVRKVSARPAKRRRSSGSKSGKIKLLDIDAMIYGGLRQKVSTMLAPIQAKIPFIGGNLAQAGDEFVMGTIDYFAAKNMGGKVREVAKKGLIVENARVGELVTDMVFAAKTDTNSTSKLYPV